MSEYIGFRLCLPYFPLLSVESFDSIVDFLIGICADGFVKLFGNMIEFDFLLSLADCRYDSFFDICANLFDFFKTESDSADHFVVGDFVSAGFDH